FIRALPEQREELVFIDRFCRADEPRQHRLELRVAGHIGRAGALWRERRESKGDYRCKYKPQRERWGRWAHDASIDIAGRKSSPPGGSQARRVRGRSHVRRR